MQILVWDQSKNMWLWTFKSIKVTKLWVGWFVKTGPTIRFECGVSIRIVTPLRPLLNNILYVVTEQDFKRWLIRLEPSKDLARLASCFFLFCLFSGYSDLRLEGCDLRLITCTYCMWLIPTSGVWWSKLFHSNPNLTIMLVGYQIHDCVVRKTQAGHDTVTPHGEPNDVNSCGFLQSQGQTIEGWEHLENLITAICSMKCMHHHSDVW